MTDTIRLIGEHSRSRLRDRPHKVWEVQVHMTPRQAEQFYDALREVAITRREPHTLTGQRALAELRRRLIVEAELE